MPQALFNTYSEAIYIIYKVLHVDHSPRSAFSVVLTNLQM